MKSVRESRVDMGELKGQIVKRIGAERAKRYFYYLNRLLSQKLSKNEFDNLCCRVLGRENLPLHNKFIHSILNNAFHANTPPPMFIGGKNSSSIEDGHEPSGSVVPSTQTQALPILSNGVVLPMLPRNDRSGIHVRKLKDKVDSSSQQSAVTEDSCRKIIMENGEMVPCDCKRSLQHLPVAEQPEKDREGSIPQSVNKRWTINDSFHPPTSLRSKDQIGVAVVEDGEEVEQANHLNICRSPLLAPLGIPFCYASIGGARKNLPVVSSNGSVSYSDSGGLSDTETLKKHMEQIAVAQGLGGVYMDCANILNRTVDVYLKRLIKSCVDLIKSRTHHVAEKQHIQPKLINGLQPTNHYHMHNHVGSAEAVPEQRSCSVSLVDFRAAMELQPQQLGEDWPLLLEKICMRGFEE